MRADTVLDLMTLADCQANVNRNIKRSNALRHVEA
jgi:hypothetical protein